ncbi:MAG: Fur family transcriptional regulator [Phycisphaerae bacterium]
MPHEEIANLLRSHGLKRTPTRVAVLQTLRTASHPLGVPEMLTLLPPGTDPVTVYRTVRALEEADLIHMVPGEEDANLYGLGGKEQGGGHHHAHFACDACGRRSCLPDAPRVESLLAQLAEATGNRAAHAEIIVHGQCAVCAEKAESA